MAEPERQYFQVIADTNWNLINPASREAIHAAAALSIDRTLKRIERLLNQLGFDGIHEILQDERTQRRRRRRRRQTVITKKQLATRARNQQKKKEASHHGQ